MSPGPGASTSSHSQTFSRAKCPTYSHSHTEFHKPDTPIYSPSLTESHGPGASTYSPSHSVPSARRPNLLSLSQSPISQAPKSALPLTKSTNLPLIQSPGPATPIYCLSLAASSGRLNLLPVSHSSTGQAPQPTLPLTLSPIRLVHQPALPLTLCSPWPGAPTYSPSHTESHRPCIQSTFHLNGSPGRAPQHTLPPHTVLPRDQAPQPTLTNTESPGPGASTYSPSHTFYRASCPNLLLPSH